MQDYAASKPLPPGAAKAFCWSGRGSQDGFGKPCPKARIISVSYWKNEGKNRFRNPLGGGLEAHDALYDSKHQLSGIPFCPTKKMIGPASRQGRPTFVPYPSSTR